jgi:hypothetical protein
MQPGHAPARLRLDGASIGRLLGPFGRLLNRVSRS